MRISWAMNVTRQVAWNRAASNDPSSRRNFIKLMLARLQAESSTNMYSAHGLEALIRPEFGQVCQPLIVESYCTPGSPQAQAASAMVLNISRARKLGPGRSGWVTQCVVHDLSAFTASMNSSD